MIVNQVNCDSLCGAHFLDLVDVMDSTVVQDQNTPRSGIGVHDFKEALEPLNKLFTVIATDFDMRINETIDGDRWEKRISGSTLSNTSQVR